VYNMFVPTYNLYVVLLYVVIIHKIMKFFTSLLFRGTIYVKRIYLTYLLISTYNIYIYMPGLSETGKTHAERTTEGK